MKKELFNHSSVAEKFTVTDLNKMQFTEKAQRQNKTQVKCQYRQGVKKTQKIKMSPYKEYTTSLLVLPIYTEDTAFIKNRKELYRGHTSKKRRYNKL